MYALWRLTWSFSLRLREVLRLQRVLESIRISVLGDEGGYLLDDALLDCLQNVSRQERAGGIQNECLVGLNTTRSQHNSLTRISANKR